MLCCQFTQLSTNLQQTDFSKRYPKYSQKYILAQKTKTKRVKSIF